MITLKQLYDITHFDDITIPFSEKLKDGKVYYRTITGEYINMTYKQHNDNEKFHNYLQRHLFSGLKLVDLSKRVSFYVDGSNNYYELKFNSLVKIDEEIYHKRIKWIKAKQRNR